MLGRFEKSFGMTGNEDNWNKHVSMPPDNTAENDIAFAIRLTIKTYMDASTKENLSDLLEVILKMLDVNKASESQQDSLVTLMDIIYKQIEKKQKKQVLNNPEFDVYCKNIVCYVDNYFEQQKQNPTRAQPYLHSLWQHRQNEKIVLTANEHIILQATITTHINKAITDNGRFLKIRDLAPLKNMLIDIRDTWGNGTIDLHEHFFESRELINNRIDKLEKKIAAQQEKSPRPKI